MYYYCLLLRKTIVNRTYVKHKNLPGIHLPIFTNKIWSYFLWFPVIQQGNKRPPPLVNVLRPGIVVGMRESMDWKPIVISRAGSCPAVDAICEGLIPLGQR